MIYYECYETEGFEIYYGNCPIPIGGLIDLPQFGVCRVDTLFFNAHNLLTGIAAEGLEGEYAGQWVSFNSLQWPLSSLSFH